MDMKKIITCAALLAGIVFFNGRLNAQVESDIVGYTTLTLTKQWNLLAIQFGDLATGSDSVDVNTIFSSIEGLSDKDQLQIPKGKSYEVVEWNATTKKWCVLDNPEVESTATVTRGRGVWLRVTGGSEAKPAVITVAGSVALNRDADNFSTGYTIVCPPAPLTGESINHSSMMWDGLVDKDQLQVPKGSSYSVAEWNATTGKWCVLDNPEAESPLTFPEGAACWLMTKSNTASMTFSVE